MNESSLSKIRKIVIEFEDLDVKDGVSLCNDILKQLEYRHVKLKSFWANGGNIHE